MIVASDQINKYFQNITTQVKQMFDIATEARKKSLDPEDFVEISLATNMAERVVGLISVIAPQIVGTGVVERIIDLEKQYTPLDWRVALKIAEEIAQEKFCKFKDKKEAIDIGIRTGFAYVTVGVVSSPIDGIVSIDIKKRMDNRGEYFCINFAGPIRNAGGTAAAVSVIITDYVRKIFGYDIYDATEEEIKRAMTEMQDYRDKVAPRQYFPSWEEHKFMMTHLPVEIGGEPSEQIEVSNYKNLPRIPTNMIRSGFALLTTECMPLKAPKLWKQISAWGKDFGLDHWFFLEEFLKIQKAQKAKSGSDKKEIQIEQSLTGQRQIATTKISPDHTYLHDLVAGRPVFSHPLRHGGLRLRYGRSRTSGFSSCCIHPASMYIVNSYLATGTQIKIERPSKGTAITACDLIEGPVVKLQNGSVLVLDSIKKAKENTDKVTEIIYFGDFLVSYGDFFNRAHTLVPAGYCEEWWAKELEKVIATKETRAKIIETTKIDEKLLDLLIKEPLKTKITAETAINLAKNANIPLHPFFTFHWQAITQEQLSSLLEALSKAEIIKTEKQTEKIILQVEQNSKRALELLAVPHTVVMQEKVVIEKENATALLSSLGLLEQKCRDIKQKISTLKDKTVLEIVNVLSGMIIKDKSGTFIGARMGRPEKAKMRKLTGSPHTLFPIGEEGGKYRCFQSALEKGKVVADFPNNYCQKCKKETVFRACDICGEKTTKQYYCKRCGWINEQNCAQHGPTATHLQKEIDINRFFTNAIKKINMKTYPDLIKGVRGTSNKDHLPEHLAKGILRAKHDIYVNKDGTTRYDMTQLPITHFKPKEIGTTLEKLRELGYEKDINGKEIVDEEQIIEIKPQDVILPGCNQFEEAGANAILFRIAQFIDDLLINLYRMQPFYNFKTIEDSVGHIVLCLAPHTSAAITARIIGFSKTQGLFAHPLIHAATRRDCFVYETYIPIFDGKNWNNIKIGELVEKLNPTKIVDDFGTKEIKVKDYKTIGVNKKGNIEIVNINNFTKHTKTKTIKITTTTQREITITQNHKLLTSNNNHIQTKEARMLKIGDKLLLPKALHFTPKKRKYFILTSLFKGREDIVVRQISSKLKKQIKEPLCNQSQKLNINYKNLQNFYTRDSFPIKTLEKLCLLYKLNINFLTNNSKIAAKRDTVVLPNKIKIDENLMEYIGLYVAEGYSRRINSNKGLAQVYIAAFDKEIRKKVADFGKKIGLKQSENKKDRITFSSRVWYEIITVFLKCGSIAYEKRAPAILFQSNKKLTSAFLRGYFEGDGSVSNTDMRVTCDSVSRGLLQDINILLLKYGIFSKFYTYTKQPGPPLRNFYTKKNKPVPQFTITKLTIPSNHVKTFAKEIKFITKRKNQILANISKRNSKTTQKLQDNKYIIDFIKKIKQSRSQTTYCLNVQNHTVLANGILTKQCDGDEACVVLLMDAFLNFSKRYLPNTRGATMDAPLVLTTILTPAEVDDMAFDLDIGWNYPLELYEAAMNYKQPWDVKIKQLKSTLQTPQQYEGMGFTHDLTDMNDVVRCSAYKTLPSMEEKLKGQMDIAEKLRSVDTSDVARLVIEKHFIKDTKGNLRKFSEQEFRCVNCNEKFRRPPLVGHCTKCKGKIIFTIAEGSVLKYLQPAISLAKKYELSPYLKQTLDILQLQVESVFGKDKEKQTGLGAWFG